MGEEKRIRNRGEKTDEIERDRTPRVGQEKREKDKKGEKMRARERKLRSRIRKDRTGE